MKKVVILILIAAAFLFITRGVAPNLGVERSYRVARDPTWYPMDMRGKDKNVLAFSDELVQRIAREEQVNIELISAPWDTLLPLLERGSCDAVLTSVQPTRRFTDRYLFSEPYLLLGPVLMVRANSDVSTLEDLQDQRLGVQTGQMKGFSIPRRARIDIQMYDEISQAIEDLIDGDLEGVVLGAFPARIAEEGYYRGQVKVVSDPLNALGLRLMTLKGDNEELVQSFNNKLEDYRKRGVITDLAVKWGIYR